MTIFNSFLYVSQAGSSSVAFLFYLNRPSNRPLGDCHKFSIDTPYYLLLGSKIPQNSSLNKSPKSPIFLRRSSQSNGLCGALSPSPAIRFHPSLAPLQRHGDRAGGSSDRAGAGGCQEEKRSRHASWPKRGDGGR